MKQTVYFLTYKKKTLILKYKVIDSRPIDKVK